MTTTTAATTETFVGGAVWGAMPIRMRVLYLSTRQRTGSWLADALAADSASQVSVQEAVGVGAAMAQLRDEVYDALLISHDPTEVDALDIVEGVRAGNPDIALVVLGVQSEQEMADLCYEVGADAYVCVNTATTRALLWTSARAIERHQLIAENRRLTQADQRRRESEQTDVERIVSQQWSLSGADAMEPQRDSASTPRRPAVDEALPCKLVEHYRELLRTHVIMGVGAMADEMGDLAELLASAGVGGAQLLRMHLAVLDELVRGLGARSARHVLTRADLLVLEALVRLSEGYQRRLHERTHPPRQLILPGILDDGRHGS